jgi:hypothetical protein
VDLSRKKSYYKSKSIKVLVVPGFLVDRSDPPVTGYTAQTGQIARRHRSDRSVRSVPILIVNSFITDDSTMSCCNATLKLLKKPLQLCWTWVHSISVESQMLQRLGSRLREEAAAGRPTYLPKATTAVSQAFAAHPWCILHFYSCVQSTILYPFYVDV